MLPSRILLAASLALLCGQTLADQTAPTATEACLDLAGRSLENNPQLEERWQSSWVDAKSVREQSYTGEVEGRQVSKQLSANLRRGRWVDGQLVCLLTEDNQAISAQFKAEANNSELPPY